MFASPGELVEAPPPSFCTVQENTADPDAPGLPGTAACVAVTVTLETPGVLGWPEITLVAESIDSPGGSPAAV